MSGNRTPERERAALDALAQLAWLSLRNREGSADDLKEFTEGEAAGVELTGDELNGTGRFSFDRLWARISEAKGGPAPAPLEDAAVPTEPIAAHRGESSMSPKARAELERQRKEALGDEEDDVATGGEDSGDKEGSSGDI